MRRVAITGIGIVSSIGNNVSEITNSLRNGTSGIVAAPEYTELGFRSQVHGTVKLDVTDHVDRKQLRFMGEGAAYAVLAMEQAIADAGLEDHQVSNERSGLVAGSGGPSTANLLAAFDITREKGPKRIGPYMVPRCMSSTVSGPACHRTTRCRGWARQSGDFGHWWRSPCTPRSHAPWRRPPRAIWVIGWLMFWTTCTRRRRTKPRRKHPPEPPPARGRAANARPRRLRRRRPPASAPPPKSQLRARSPSYRAGSPVFSRVSAGSR